MSRPRHVLFCNNVTMPSRPNGLSLVLSTWFPNEGYVPYWFDGTYDKTITHVFEEVLEEEERGNYDHQVDYLSMLARIVLLGQISYIIYGRQSAKAAVANEKAVHLVMVLMESDADWSYPIMKRVFLLIPLIKAKMYSYCHSKINDYMKTVMEDDSDESNILRWLAMQTVQVANSP
jgi:uncharacterized protein (DUF924 family)